jgi:hypothetical protein
MNDIKFAIRRLLKSPGFTVMAVAALALCLGANIAIFAVLDGILCVRCRSRCRMAWSACSTAIANRIHALRLLAQ